MGLRLVDTRHQGILRVYEKVGWRANSRGEGKEQKNERKQHAAQPEDD